MADFDAVLSTDILSTFAISPEISAKVLRTDAGGSPVALEVTFAPGAVWPGEDIHSDSAEAVYVQSGVLRTGVPGSGVDKVDDRCPAGSLVCAEQGTSHRPFSDTGCTLLLFYPDKWKGSAPAV